MRPQQITLVRMDDDPIPGINYSSDVAADSFQS
jgi:hypothetical protein